MPGRYDYDYPGREREVVQRGLGKGETEEHKECVGQGGRVDCKERGMAQKRQQKEAKMSMEGKGGTGGIDLSWELHREASEGGRQGGGEG